MYRKISIQKKKGWRNLLKIWLVLVAFAMISLIVPYHEAKTFPDRPVQMVIPYPAGSASDVAARVIQPWVEKSLGVRLIIQNIPGADSRIGLTKLHKAKPDGYTIGFSGFHIPIIHEALFDVPYKALDFSYIHAWTMNSGFLFVSADSGWKTFDDFLSEARKRTMNVGLTGMGSATHLLALGLAKTMNLKFKYIPFSGGAQGYAALAGNHIDANVGSELAALGLYRAKKIVPLLNWSYHPNPTLPDVPLSPKYKLPTIPQIRGEFGPPGMSEERVRFLEKVFSKAAAEPKVVEWAKDTGTDLISLSAKQSRQDVERQQLVVREYKDLLKTP